MKPEIEEQKEFDNSFLLEKEKEIFGFYISNHPTTMYLKDNPYCVSLNDIDQYFDKVIDVLILVEKIKTINTKKGDKMAFITGSDETARREFILFPSVYQNYMDIKKGSLLKIRGRVEKRLNEVQVIVDKIKYLQGDEHEE